VMGDYNWRLADGNIWALERMLLNHPHKPIKSSDTRIDRLRRRYHAFKAQFPEHKPLFYRGREKWSELPPEFRGRQPRLNRRADASD
jgi:hypothetical protein